MSLQTIALMKEALDKEGLKPHLMAQPICYHAPDVGPKGFLTLPEIEFGELSSFPVAPQSTHSVAEQLCTLNLRLETHFHNVEISTVD